MSCLFLLNVIYKQVGVDSEMCSDIDTDGRNVQSLFYFFQMGHTKYLSCNEASGNSKVRHSFF